MRFEQAVPGRARPSQTRCNGSSLHTLMEMLAFVVATLLFGGLVVAAIRLWLTADLGGSTAPTPSPNLETMTLVEPQALAKSKGLTGVSRLAKAALIQKLRTAKGPAVA